MHDLQSKQNRYVTVLLVNGTTRSLPSSNDAATYVQLRPWLI